MSARTYCIAIGTMAFLGAGTAFAVQALRKQPDLAVPFAAAVAPLEAGVPEVPVAETATPLTAHLVRTVFIREEPGETPEPTSQAERIQNQDTAAEASAPGAAPDEVHRPSFGASVASLVQAEQLEASTAEQAPLRSALPKPARARKTSSALPKQTPRRAKHEAGAAAKESEPSQPAYDTRNEFHSPIQAIGKLFSGAQ